MSEDSPTPLLRFKCTSCGTSLGVDPSLAGVEGPCPRCGVLLTAPQKATKPKNAAPGPSATIPSSGVTRAVRGGLPPSRSSSSPLPPVSATRAAPQQRRRRSSRIAQPKRISEDDKASFWQFAKIALAVVCAILIFLAVSYYLKNY